jgi:hypothetical protein
MVGWFHSAWLATRLRADTSTTPPTGDTGRRPGAVLGMTVERKGACARSSKLNKKLKIFLNQVIQPARPWACPPWGWRVTQPDGAGWGACKWSARAHCGCGSGGYFRANNQIVWMLDGKLFRLGSEQRVCSQGDVLVSCCRDEPPAAWLGACEPGGLRRQHQTCFRRNRP